MSQGDPVEQVGSRVLAGRYHLIEHLAQGGMGAIWAARDGMTGDDVAVKLLRSDLADQATARFRFGREVRALARLHHPGIVRIRDYGEDHLGRPFYVMELLQGRPLSGYKRGTFPVPLLLHLFEEVLHALAYAHARGVIHRDLKPENILLTRDSLRRFHATLVDFGIASVAHEGGPGAATMASMVGTFVVGTPEYMSPEQVQGFHHELMAPCDLYAIGVMLYEYITGQVPFAGATPLATATLQLTEGVPEVVPTQPQVTPRGVADLIRRLLAKDPWERPQFAAEVRAEIAELRRESEALRAGLAATPSGSMSIQMEALARETDEGTSRQTVLSAAAAISAQAHDLPAGGYGEWLDLEQESQSPVLGYAETRLRLWDMLEAVDAEGEARVVFLEGSGEDLAKVPRWLRGHAEELGRAMPLVARFDEVGQGIVGVAEWVLRCGGLDRRGVQKQAERFLRRCGVEEPYEASLLTELLRPEGELGSNMAMLTPLSRRSVFDRLLRRASLSRRPVLLTLEAVDGATLEDEVAPLLRHLMQGALAAPWPLLVVVSGASGGLGSRPAVQALLGVPGVSMIEALDEHRGMPSGSFDALAAPVEESASILDEFVSYDGASEDAQPWLGAAPLPTMVLDEAAAQEDEARRVAQVEEAFKRAPSRPAIPARAEVSEFEIFDEALLPAADEAPSVRPAVAGAPEGVGRVAPARHRALDAERLAASDRERALACAAVYGPSFPFEGLARAVEALGGVASMRLDHIWRLFIAQGIWIELDGGERAAFANVRERQRVLEGAQRDAADWRALHRSVAESKRAALGGRSSAVGLAREIAEHLLQAEAPEAALDALRDAARAAVQSGLDDPARRVLDFALRLAAKVDTEATRRVRGEIMVAQGHIELRGRRLERALQRFASARGLCIQGGDRRGAAESLVGLAKIADARGQHDTAQERFREAAEELEALSEPLAWVEAARARLGEALAAARLGRWRDARFALNTLRIHLETEPERLETPVGHTILATCLAMSARVEHELGSLDAFQELAGRALETSSHLVAPSPTLAKLMRALAAAAGSAEGLDPGLKVRLAARADEIFRVLGLAS